MKTVIVSPIRRSGPGLKAGETAITVRISGLETTIFLVNRAAMAAGYQVDRTTENIGASQTVLRGKSLRDTALFMLEVAEIVQGTWWAIRNRGGFSEKKLNLDVIEKLEAALKECERFELRT